MEGFPDAREALRLYFVSCDRVENVRPHRLSGLLKGFRGSKKYTATMVEKAHAYQHETGRLCCGVARHRMAIQKHFPCAKDITI